jgi:hypothetical protein
MGYLGRPVTAMSSFSATPMKNRRCVRRTPPKPKLRHLLLLTPWPQLSPSWTPMMHPTGCKMIVMIVATSIECKIIVVTLEMRPVSLRPLRQKGCL